jgi:hypothetical protein
MSYVELSGSSVCSSDGDTEERMTAEDVAQWMFEEVTQRGSLDQGTAAHLIRTKLSRDFVYINGSGNWSIGRKILRVFKKFSEETVVWERSSRVWRVRRGEDKPGRRQG